MWTSTRVITEGVQYGGILTSSSMIGQEDGASKPLQHVRTQRGAALGPSGRKMGTRRRRKINATAPSRTVSTFSTFSIAYGAAGYLDNVWQEDHCYRLLVYGRTWAHVSHRQPSEWTLQ